MQRPFIIALAAMHFGCAALAGIDDYQSVDCVDPACGDAASEEDGFATDDAATDTTDTTTGTLDTSADTTNTTDTAKDTAIDTGADTSPAGCSVTPTKLVTLGAWSIDATEVTNAQYAAFLAATGSATTGQPEFCSWNTSFVPKADWPAAPAKCDFPVVAVDWCDAAAYCAWAKKRLCGSPTGGATPFDTSGPTSAATSQWFAACSGGGTAQYPYGDVWSSGVCVDNAYDGMAGTSPADTTRRVGSATSCHGTGAYASLFDLTGNVREWEDDCDGQKDGGDNCRTRGGAFNDPSDKATCANTFTVHRDTAANNIGFRCCAP